MDGEIIIKTSIDTSGLEKGVGDINKQLDKLKGNIKECDDKSKKFFKDYSKETKSSEKKSKKLESALGVDDSSSGSSSSGSSGTKKSNSLSSLIGNGSKKGSGISGVESALASAGQKVTGFIKKFLSIAAVIALFNKLKQQILDSAETMSKYDSETNRNFSTMKSSFAQLQGAIKIAFMPLVNFVLPIVSKVTQAITAMVNKVAQFTAALTGAKTAKQATYVYKDYAASLNSTADAAKKAQSYLTGLDEIRKNDSDDSSSGSGDSGNDDGFGISEVEIDSSISDAAKKVLEFIEHIKEKLSPIVDTIKDCIEKTKEWAEKLNVAPLLESLMGFIDSILDLLVSISALLGALYTTVVLPVGTWLIEKVLPPFLDFLTAINEDLTEIIDATTEWIETADFSNMQESADNFADSLSELWSSLEMVGDKIVWLYENVILPIVNFLATSTIPILLQSLAEVVSGTAQNIAGIVEILDGFMNGDMETVEKGLEDFALGLWTVLFAPIKATGLAIWEALKAIWFNLLVPLGETIGSAFESFGGWISDVFTNLGKWFSDKWEEYKAWLLGIVQKITEKIDQIFPGWRQTIVALINAAISKVKEIIGNVVSWILEKWNWLKDKTTALYTSIKTKVIETFTGIKTKVIETFTNMKTKLVEIFKQLKESLKTPINGIIGFLNKLISAAVTGVNGLIGAINKIKITVPDWVSKISGVSSLGFNIPTVTAPQIPYLAQGAVIPPNKEFMAVLGDQTNGNNLEAPEELIRQIVREESGGNSKGNTYQITATANRKVLFDLVIDEAKARQMQTGKNPFDFAY